MSDLQLSDPQHTLDYLTNWIQLLFQQQHKEQAVIAVSGGIDSAVALTLASKALGPAKILPLFLPFASQSTTDARLIANWNMIPESNWHEYNIEPIVQAAVTVLESKPDQVRRGNLMARARMLIAFDQAKAQNALVVGTENKSEHYLGYFTRFGDAAADLEPLSGLYKTQVRQLATFLDIPPVFLNKAPSAGLWEDQTDEQELGFSYQVADQVLYQLIDLHQPVNQIVVPGVEAEIIERVAAQVTASDFKRVVPYLPKV